MYHAPSPTASQCWSQGGKPRQHDIKVQGQVSPGVRALGSVRSQFADHLGSLPKAHLETPTMTRLPHLPLQTSTWLCFHFFFSSLTKPGTWKSGDPTLGTGGSDAKGGASRTDTAQAGGVSPTGPHYLIQGGLQPTRPNVELITWDSRVSQKRELGQPEYYGCDAVALRVWFCFSFF